APHCISSYLDGFGSLGWCACRRSPATRQPSRFTGSTPCHIRVSRRDFVLGGCSDFRSHPRPERRAAMEKFVSSRISRRRFLKWTGAAALAAGAAPYLNRVRAQSGTLRILQWSHFVPAYDTWFDQYAVQWGEANGVE